MRMHRLSYISVCIYCEVIYILVLKVTTYITGDEGMLDQYGTVWSR